MKIILVIVIACFSLSISFAQVTREWARYYNGPANLSDYAKDIEVDTNGYVYVAGTSDNGVGGSDITLVKYDSSGQQLWVERYNLNNGLSEFERSTLDHEGNIIITGHISYNYDSVKVITIKYNPQGQLLWSRIFFSPDYFNLCRSITTDNDGNTYVVGRQDHRQIDAEQIFTIKYNGSGDIQWVKYYGSQGYADIYDLDVDTFGNVYISGVVGVDNDEDVKIVTIKYNSAGVEQWTNITDTSPYGYVIDVSLDDSGNIYVVGSQYNNNWNDETFIMKYNNSGSLVWAQIYLGQYANKAAVNSDGDIYFTSSKYVNGSPNSSIVKYNSAGVKQWESLYEHPASLIDLVLDEVGNVYAAGFDPSTIYYKYLTVKYNSDGIKQWAEKNDSTNNAHEFARAIALDKGKNVYVAGYSSIAFGPNDYLTIKYSQQNDALRIIKPAPGERLVTGEKHTIEWTGGQPGQLLSIDYSTDKGQTFLDIAFAVPAETGYYEWDVPFDLLTTKAKIKITDIADTNVYALSDTFKIKGYVLTRINGFGNYENYDIIDIYSFANTSSSLWPQNWWQQFNYSGTDPFTGFSYLEGGEVTSNLFFGSKRSDFPDWVSWVRTFGSDVCYYRKTFPPTYSPAAVLKWRSRAEEWGGSCFGMSTSSALLFKHGPQFYSRYPSFPTNAPFFILSNDNVKTVINEFFTNQFGKEHLNYRYNVGLQKTPNETLNDIKKMLIDDEPVRTLSIVSNNPNNAGGHSILAYQVDQDFQFPNIYNVFVYDNSYPNFFGNSVIVVDTAANNGNGAWFPTYAWQNWGGTKYFYLRELAIDYLTKPSLPENQKASPFFLENTELQIYNIRNASVTITDAFGNSTGYVNGTLFNEIPNSFPEIIENGSSGPPIGYYLPNATYSVKMENYNEEPMAGFFTGNKAFMFSRDSYQSNQTDNLFFDGGISYTNPDTIPKQISLLSVFGEVSDDGKSTTTASQIFSEKAYAVSNLLIAPSDSIVLDYSYDEKLILKNFGGAKNYVLSVELAGEFSSGSFRNENITLPPNSSHTVVPDWNDLYNSTLQILVDEENDGVFDDTLHVDNLLGDPVPVELLTFIAVNTSSGVKLNWQTATEVNNYGFEVERKSFTQNNTEGWNKLVFVPGAGNSSSPKLYSFTDKTAKEGKYQYRLKQLDADGKFQFSSVIEIDVKNVPLVFALEQNYPNPFNPSTKISWQSPVSSHQTLKVYDVLGNEVATLVNEFREAGRYEIVFDASKYNLSSGVYFYQLKAEGFSAVKKFILAK